MNLQCFQVLVLGNAFTLEQRLQLADQQVQGSSSLHNLLIHNKVGSLIINLLLLFIYCRKLFAWLPIQDERDRGGH